MKKQIFTFLLVIFGLSVPALCMDFENENNNNVVVPVGGPIKTIPSLKELSAAKLAEKIKNLAKTKEGIEEIFNLHIPGDFKSIIEAPLRGKVILPLWVKKPVLKKSQKNRKILKGNGISVLNISWVGDNHLMHIEFNNFREHWYDCSNINNIQLKRDLKTDRDYYSKLPRKGYCNKDWSDCFFCREKLEKVPFLPSAFGGIFKDSKSTDKEKLKKYYLDHLDNISAIGCSPDGNFLVSVADENKTICFFDRSDGEDMVKLIKCEKHCDSHDCLLVGWSPDGKYLLLTSKYGIRVYDFSDIKNKNIKFIEELKYEFGVLLRKSQGWSLDSKYLAIGSRYNDVRVYDFSEIKNGNIPLIATFDDHSEEISVVSFNPKGSCLATGSCSQVNVYDLSVFKIIDILSFNQLILLQFLLDEKNKDLQFADPIIKKQVELLKYKLGLRKDLPSDLIPNLYCNTALLTEYIMKKHTK